VGMADVEVSGVQEGPQVRIDAPAIKYYRQH
jgi:hypothetical protein